MLGTFDLAGGGRTKSSGIVGVRGESGTGTLVTVLGGSGACALTGETGTACPFNITALFSGTACPLIVILDMGDTLSVYDGTGEGAATGTGAWGLGRGAGGDFLSAFTTMLAS